MSFGFVFSLEEDAAAFTLKENLAMDSVFYDLPKEAFEGEKHRELYVVINPKNISS